MEEEEGGGGGWWLACGTARSVRVRVRWRWWKGERVHGLVRAAA
jgi:hypothetical protein